MRVLRSGFILFAENRIARDEKRRNRKHCVDQRMGGTSVGEEVEWDERTSRETRQEKKEWYRRCAGAPAREPPTLLPRCRRRVTTGGIRDRMIRSSFAMPLSEIRIAGDQSAGRVPDLSNGHYYTGNKSDVWRQRACYRNFIFPAS